MLSRMKCKTYDWRSHQWKKSLISKRKIFLGWNGSTFNTKSWFSSLKKRIRKLGIFRSSMTQKVKKNPNWKLLIKISNFSWITIFCFKMSFCNSKTATQNSKATMSKWCLWKCSNHWKASIYNSKRSFWIMTFTDSSSENSKSLELKLKISNRPLLNSESNWSPSSKAPQIWTTFVRNWSIISRSLRMTSCWTSRVLRTIRAFLAKKTQWV